MRSLVGVLRPVRPWPVYLLAASLPISMASVSITKMLVVLASLAVLLVAVRKNQPLATLTSARIIPLILIMLAVLLLSTSYTSATGPEVIKHLVKYSKLMVIILIPVLLTTEQQAQKALLIALASQAFVTLTSYLMSWGVPAPWIPPDRASLAGWHTPYSSYLDQGLMTAGCIALSWHLRTLFTFRWARQVAILIALLSIICLVLFLPGRSGYVALFAVVVLALGWHWQQHGPRIHYRKLLPAALLIVMVAFTMPSTLRDRLVQVVTEVQAYTSVGNTNTSTGTRLNLWHRAVQSMAEKPLTGHGVGSFKSEFLRLEGLPPSTELGYNAHQEFLQWGVQLGLPGIALLIALMGTLVRDARRFPVATRRALVSVVTVFGVACLFNSALADAFIGDYFCSVLGMLLALGLNQLQATHTESNPV
jgi:O-antigen ligase